MRWYGSSATTTDILGIQGYGTYVYPVASLFQNILAVESISDIGVPSIWSASPSQGEIVDNPVHIYYYYKNDGTYSQAGIQFTAYGTGVTSTTSNGFLRIPADVS